MRPFSLTISTAIALAVLAGCSNNGSAPAIPATSGAGQSPTVPAGSRTGASRFGPGTAEDVFVADENGNAVSIYNTAGAYQYSIKAKDGVDKPDALTFDSEKNLYVANLGNGSVTVYAPGQTTPSDTIKTDCPTAIRVPTGGDLYVANPCDNTVSIFNSTGSEEQVLVQNICDPQALNFDTNGDLFVANGGTTGAKSPCNTVAKCTGGPPLRQCKTSDLITADINNPDALVVTTDGFLFVANDVAAGSVTKYKVADGSYVNTWGAGDLDEPNALALDGTNHLCAASWGNDSVYCFSTPTLPFKVLTAADGIENPMGLASLPEGDLYIANNFSNMNYPKGNVTKYCPKKSCKSDKHPITTAINGPVRVLIHE